MITEVPQIQKRTAVITITSHLFDEAVHFPSVPEYF